ncbi:pheromone-binding protein Gp-9 isoform X2 [Harpegnathos saltator]|uniref:pheromone-binding protein Gp-9 isoform X2 n=1 Tax=Harpegnathos saltator TaxID=610380 RepID=UPI00058C65FB|nr:pheromone-binding protein Gp-9 isoform X2 [Harpegnathos saltator]
MKRSLALLLIFVIPTIISADDFVEKLAEMLSLTQEDVQKCIEKTGTTQDDIMHFDQIVTDNLQTVDFDEKAKRLGCFFSCLGQKMGIMTDGHLNVDKMKQIIRSKVKNPEKLAVGYRILDICNDQVRSKTNECEISIRFLLCMADETERLRKNDMQRRYEDNNDNE